MQKMTNSQEGYIVEFHQVGNSVRVTAFDPVSMLEAVVIGPLNASQQQLAELAVRKLHYIMGKAE